MVILEKIEVAFFGCHNGFKHDFTKPVTIFSGDTGAGKSTIGRAIRFLFTGAVPPITSIDGKNLTKLAGYGTEPQKMSVSIVADHHKYTRTLNTLTFPDDGALPNGKAANIKMAESESVPPRWSIEVACDAGMFLALNGKGTVEAAAGLPITPELVELNRRKRMASATRKEYEALDALMGEDLTKWGTKKAIETGARLAKVLKKSESGDVRIASAACAAMSRVGSRFVGWPKPLDEAKEYEKKLKAEYDAMWREQFVGDEVTNWSNLAWETCKAFGVGCSFAFGNNGMDVSILRERSRGERLLIDLAMRSAILEMRNERSFVIVDDCDALDDAKRKTMLDTMKGKGFKRILLMTNKPVQSGTGDGWEVVRLSS